MIINFNKYKKSDKENELQYIWRICSAKDSGEIDANWTEVAELLNAELGNNYDESAYRKKYSSGKLFLNDVFSKMENASLKDFYEIEKEKVKMRDERNELKRIIRDQARKETMYDMIYRVASEFSYNAHADVKYEDYDQDDVDVESKDNDLLISLTDIHAGIVIDNIFNEFDNNTLRERLDKYAEKIKEVQARHKSEKAYVVLSELISGAIHSTLRLESNQNVIEQFVTVSEYLAHFLYSLKDSFKEIHVFVCPGNHSRVFPKKEDNRYGENFDHLVIPFLTALLQNFSNIQFHDNFIEKSMAAFMVRGKTVYAVHGDKDSPNTVVKNLTMQFDNRPDIVMMGHRHTNSMQTEYDVKVLQAGSMSGTDNYCLDNRLRNKPEQLIAVVNEDGIDCIYDVTLD